jgi:signal transduction histidine kinase
MLALGTWVTRRIEQGVVETSAASAALYINNFIAPHLQGLKHENVLSPQNVAALNQAMARPALRSHVTSIKVWKQDGLIVYSSNPDLIGRHFPANPYPQRALNGILSAEYGNLYHEEDSAETTDEHPLLEVYAPIRDSESGDVIAVLEFHERAEALTAHLKEAEWNSWVVTAFVAVSMIAALFSIVAEGSRTIDEQRLALTERVTQLSELLRQNERLRMRIERAARKTTEENERLMRRLGYDLHDGIAQLIGLALLRLGSLTPAEKDEDNIAKIQNALSDALEDVRHLCKGFLLPEIHGMSLRDALLFMSSHHEKRTGTVVECKIADLPEKTPQVVTTSLCRFVQEGLTNAFRHAQAKGQELIASWDGKAITVEIRDAGPGFSPLYQPGKDGGLGLMGLGDRMESIGGVMSINTVSGRGTQLRVVLPIAVGEHDGS